jgi:vacuolar-type H+-ATPase subunit H
MSETRAIETVRRAEKDAVKTVSDAQVRQLEGVASAKASVAEFLASVEADGTYADSYRYQKYIQAIAAAYGDAKIIIVGEGVDGGNIYLGSVPVGTIVP